MRCSCQKCGTYMIQSEEGLKSGCRCPDCGHMCRDCMGSVQGPMTPDEIREAFVGFVPTIAPERFVAEEEPEDRPLDWRKLL